ncbi:tetratricopeptide repeat protein [Actinoplanes sp. NPDC020271]|uniref:tetratricopeptide repeat protein n=1 Tax=Actinoplanes sp. NPDC020271 TaxID=3363896 RepID=UPI0037ADA4C2
MQARRVVSVEAPGRQVSGWLIAGRLVLTTADAVQEAGTEVTVRPVVSGRPFAGVVTWRGPGGAALVRVDDPAWIEVDGPVTRFGRVVTERPGLPVEVVGFGAVEVWRAAGSVSAEGDRLRLVIEHGPQESDVHEHGRQKSDVHEHEPQKSDVHEHEPQKSSADEHGLRRSGAGQDEPPTNDSDNDEIRHDGEPGAAPVGAVVFGGELLVGLVGEDHEVVTVGELCRAAGFVDAAAVSALGPFELAEAQLTESDQPRSPVALLRAGARVVGFRGRHDVMDELGAWCSGAGFAALLLHAPAGEGKSRIGYELAGRLTAGGWATLWLDETAPDVVVAAVADVVAPLLIVVDAAESRPEQLRTLLRACARHDGSRPLRVLMLARTAGDWWRLLRSDLIAERLLDGASVLELAPLDDAGFYAASVYALATALPQVPGYAMHHWAPVAARLAAEPRETTGRALAVQTLALADLLDAMWPGPAVPVRKTPEDRVLAHEQRYWSFTAAWHGLTLDEPVLQDVLAVAALFGPTGPDQADRLLSGVPALAGAPRELRDTVRNWLADLYPGAGGRPWGTLQPERLAEWFAGRRLAESPVLPEPLIPVVTESQRRRMLTVYARAAGHAASLTDLCVRHADRLTQATVETAISVARPEPLLVALQQIVADPDVPVERLALIADRLPRLSPLAMEIAQRIADQHRRAGRMPELAAALNNLSIRLGDLGRHGPALAAIEEAVLIHRRLAGEAPEMFEADLARSLGNLSVRLGELEQPEPALAAIDEATALYRRLVERKPGTYLPELGKSLMSLSLGLGALERFPPALTAIEESVAIFGHLAGQRPDTFRPDLAAALSVLGISLGSLDRDEQSRVAAQEAAAIRRQLASQRPDVHLPGLAAALTDLAVRHAVLGEKPPALAAIEEALTIRHQLAEKSPEAFAADLDWSLHVHKVVLEMGS